MYYVGLDINPLCKKLEKPKEHHYIEIGSQYDPEVLADLCAKHGPFDMVVDDGAHTSDAIRNSLTTIWPGALANDDGMR